MTHKRLYLLRHAKSDWTDETLEDFDRPLAERGERSGRLMTNYLVARNMRPDLVLVSMARRARQTFDLIAPALDGVPVLFEDRLYTFAADHLITRLSELPDEVASVMVVGHNPALQELAMALTDAMPETPDLVRLREKVPTGTLITLEADGPWASLQALPWQLTAYCRPKDLKPRV